MRRRHVTRGVIAIVIALVLGLCPHAAAATITGTAGHDSPLVGTNRSDTIDGLGGNDDLFDRKGDDDVTGGTGSDQYFLGAGDDIVTDDTTLDNTFDDDGRAKGDVGDVVNLDATSGDLVISADGEVDTIDCDGGSGDVLATDVDDILIDCGTPANEEGETFTWGITRPLKPGTNQKDVITASTTSAIAGKGGDDKLTGSDGNDVLLTGRGADRANGGAGSDYFFDLDGQSGDLLNGGTGQDEFYSIDGAADTIKCGDDGPNVLYVDKKDTLSGCNKEVIFLYRV